MITAIRFMYTWARVRFHISERGQDLIEYALLGGFIAVAFAVAAVVAGFPGVFTTMTGDLAECLDLDTTCP